MTPQIKNRKAGTAAVILLAFLLFYFPSMLALISHDSEPKDMTMFNILMATCYTGIFCVNYFLIVPKIFFGKDSKLLFFIINIFLVAILCSLLPLWIEAHGGLPRPRHLQKIPMTYWQHLMGYLRFIIRDGVMMILSIALAYAMRASKAREEMRSRVLELEAERRNTELMSLKAQLNPHFLFNSLNNIYALIAIDPDKAQQSLHELSSMLRFMIYDSEASAVSLSKEMQFISDFTRLMSLRLNPSVKLTCTLPKIKDNTLHIAPLLILTLIENAFKHVAVIDNDGFININITLNTDRLFCMVSNSCRTEHIENLEKGISGVGLINIEKQLRLLYPGEFSLKTENSAGEYRAELTIITSALRQSSGQL
ncbi:MAG: sensor histidine kinase [Muribaculaceae bacterium]|nr:sensor histidine kinase [Muribaculaceae bacterium]